MTEKSRDQSPITDVLADLPATSRWQERVYEKKPEVTRKITSAIRSHFGSETAFDLGRVTASEDFSRIPDALGTPYTYWGVGCTDSDKIRASSQGRSGRTGHPGKRLSVLCASYRADAFHRHAGPCGCTDIPGEVRVA
jgi:hypothetical protein